MNSHGGLLAAEKTVASGNCPRLGTEVAFGQPPAEKLLLEMDGFMEEGAVCRAGPGVPIAAVGLSKGFRKAGLRGTGQPSSVVGGTPRGRDSKRVREAAAQAFSVSG